MAHSCGKNHTFLLYCYYFSISTSRFAKLCGRILRFFAVYYKGSGMCEKESGGSGLSLFLFNNKPYAKEHQQAPHDGVEYGEHNGGQKGVDHAAQQSNRG